MYTSGFVAAATEFIFNIVSFGVCSNDGCLNSNKHGRFSLPCLSRESIPVSPPAPAVLEAVTTAEDFPAGVMGRQLCSSPNQLSVPLKKYMGNLFTAALDQFGCALGTLVHCLWLLERMQTKNILAHQKGTITLRNSFSRVGNGADDEESGVESWSSLPPEPATPTDKSGEDGGAHLLPSATPSDAVSVGPLSESDDESLCRACAEANVFGLQLWNVQLYAAATLLLSMKINEDAFAETDEEALTNHVSSAACCEPVLLRCAERCVCDILWDDLQVTEKSQESLMRRLGMRSFFL